MNRDFSSSLKLAESEYRRLAFSVFGYVPEALFEIVQCTEPWDESYGFRRENGIEVFSGTRGRAVLYAVYDYFRRCGVSYYWDGDILPQEKKTVMPEDFRGRPALRYRGLRYFAHRGLRRFCAEMWDAEAWKRELDYLVKRGFNMFMLRTGDDDMFALAFGCCDDDYTSKDGFYDRTPFRSLEERRELRRRIVEMARERDLIMPVDCGAMTHWYTPTPSDYLKRYKPEFLSQSNDLYTDRSLLVWDVRQSRYMEEYFKLTDAYVSEYGHSGVFHTIGLAERLFGASPEEDRSLKKRVYSMISDHISGKYPGSVLFIGTWDFAMAWNAEQVSGLVETLDPGRTVIFDYVSDTTNESSNFTKWGVVGKFPYICGIFHAYAPNTEPRGDYSYIEGRLNVAAGDRFCKGLVTWQELSHGDGLMLEFTARNAISPGTTVGECLRSYAGGRFGDDADDFVSLAQRALPLIGLMRYRHDNDHPERNVFRDFYLSLTPSRFGYSPEYFSVSRRDAARNEYLIPEYEGVMYLVPEILRGVAELARRPRNEQSIRDLTDLARCAASRWLNWAVMQAQQLYYTALSRGDAGCSEAEDALRIQETVTEVMRALAGLLDCSDDFSLYATWEYISAQGADASFLKTLLKNASNDYCRSPCSETMYALSIPEAEQMQSVMCEMLSGKADRDGCINSAKARVTDFESLSPEELHALRGAGCSGMVAERVDAVAELISGFSL